MANTYKNTPFTLSSSAAFDVYTCPSNATAIIQNIQAFNKDSDAVVCFVRMKDASDSLHVYPIASKSIGASLSAKLNDGIIILEASDVLELQTNSAIDKVEGLVNILEITRD